MSFSLVKKGLDLLDNDFQSDSNHKKDSKKSGEMKLKTAAKASKAKNKSKLKDQQKPVKSFMNSAYDEREKYEKGNKLQRNIQYLKEMSALTVADKTIVEKIMNHQRGRLAKNNPVKQEKKKKEKSVFSDKDFEKFAKEYRFQT